MRARPLPIIARRLSALILIKSAKPSQTPEAFLESTRELGRDDNE
jgi:hypothetical protein